jgi:hypothetical protein
VQLRVLRRRRVRVGRDAQVVGGAPAGAGDLVGQLHVGLRLGGAFHSDNDRPKLLV